MSTPKDLPLKIKVEYREFLEGLWERHTPSEQQGTPLVLEEQKPSKLTTDDDHERIVTTYKDATTITLLEKISKSNHEDVTYYNKGLPLEYTKDLLLVMREYFLEEITGHHIENKTFED